MLINWEEILQSDPYFHAELGYLCPAPRLRRELRVACWAGLFGIAVGAASVIALSRTDPAANSTSPVLPAATQPGAVDTVPRQLVDMQRKDLQKPAAMQPSKDEAVRETPTRHANTDSSGPDQAGATATPRSNEVRRADATKARSHVRQRDNGPELARVPLGRPAEFEAAPPPTTETDSARAVALAAPARAVAAPAKPRAEGAPSEPPRAEPVWDPNPRRIVRAPNPPQKQQSETLELSSGSSNGSGERAYAHDTRFPRTVFWDWSR